MACSGAVHLMHRRPAGAVDVLPLEAAAAEHVETEECKHIEWFDRIGLSEPAGKPINH